MNDTFCADIPNEPPFGWTFKTRTSGVNASSGVYNPLNENEIFFIDESGFLIRWNRISGARIKLDSNVTGGIPVVDEKNGLIYHKLSLRIYYCDNKSKVMEIPVIGGGLYPMWLRGSSEFYYNSPNTGEIHKSDLSGARLDSVPGVRAIKFYVKDSLLIHHRARDFRQYIYLKNLKTNVDRFIATSEVNGEHVTVEGYFLDSENKNLYYYSAYTLFKFDLQTGDSRSIIRGCPLLQYFNYSINSSSTKLIATRATCRQIDDQSIYYQMDLVEFNIDGTGETVLAIE